MTPRGDVERTLSWRRVVFSGARVLTALLLLMGLVSAAHGQEARMRGIGYSHPYWGHGTNHGELETGRESIRLEDFDPTDFHSLHLQSLVIARMGNRTGVGVLEQAHFGPHTPSGLTGPTAGHGP